MLHFSSLSLVAAYALSVVLAAPQTLPPSQSICSGYQWGVIIHQLINAPETVYNQYVTGTACNGPAWVSSSSEPNPPASISPWGTRYDCEVPEIMYFCGEDPVATCCGKLA